MMKLNTILDRMRATAADLCAKAGVVERKADFAAPGDVSAAMRAQQLRESGAKLLAEASAIDRSSDTPLVSSGAYSPAELAAMKRVLTNL